MKKWFTIIIVLLVFVVSVWFVITFRRAVDSLLDAENRGHAYRNFFGVLELYTAQTGKFPDSLDDMLIIQTELGYEGVRWPHDADFIAELIQPDFNVTPDANNLSEFAPDYKINAAWSAEMCEFYWGLIIERLNADM